MSTKHALNNKMNNNPIETKKRFEMFLKEYKVESGIGAFHTHTAFGEPWGLYNVPDSQMDKFFELYINCMQNKIDLHMIERPKNIGPLLIDIDFNLGEEHEERQYRLDDIQYIIGVINGIIRKYYKWTPKNLQAFVLEKGHATVKENKETGITTYKDGFHIHYPFMPISEKMRFFILHEAKNQIIENGAFKHIPFTNEFDEVFDLRVVKSNGWLMYGSRKDKCQPYYLTHIYSCTFNEEELGMYKHRELVRILSNRKYNDNDECELKDTINKKELNEQIEQVLQICGVSKNKQNNKTTKTNKKLNAFSDDNQSSENDDNIESIKAEILRERSENNKIKNKQSKVKEIELAKRLASILSDERATGYDSWCEVGWALYNTSPELLQAFKNFSKKSSKYDSKGCEDFWAKCKLRDNGLKIGSLKYWAEQDNPEAYHEIILDNVNHLLVEAESGTEFDMANVIYEIYKDKYKCTSIKHDTWYEFQNHRWKSVEEAYTLNLKMSRELTKDFALLNSLYMKQLSSTSGTESDDKLKQAMNVLKNITKLKKTGFKEQVMKDCRRLFKDGEFEEKLDSNNKLIGFENGVYDLEKGIFRPGHPDDLVSISVGYDYEEYSLDHEYVKGIEKYFSQIQREEDMKNYILTLLSTYLDGGTENQKFIIWTGSGCHAQGTEIRMLDGSVKKVEDIIVGDKLMGEDGTARKVKHLYRGKDKMYKIRQEKGNSYIVNRLHRLALKFVGDIKKIYNKYKQRFEVVWYNYNDKNGISKFKKHFKLENDANNCVEDIKSKQEYIPNNHKIIMTVANYIQLSQNIQQLLHGYNVADLESSHRIQVEYCGKDDYYGFELSGNQKYVLEDGTITLNSNGKSTTIELFQQAFGNYCAVVPITLLTRKSGGSSSASPELAELRGKRFVVLQEPENNDEIQIGKMKELSGGDYIYARPLFKDPIRYKPQFKLLLTCNELPRVPSTDGGTWRRVRVSPFESEFVDDPKLPHQFKKDYELLGKLKLWRKAFMWYLLKVWYPVYKQHGLKEPKKVTEFTDIYKKDSDIIYEFLDANFRLTKNNNDFENISGIYSAMKYWYSDQYNSKCPYKQKDVVKYLTNNRYIVKNGYLYGVVYKSEEEQHNAASHNLDQ